MKKWLCFLVVGLMAISCVPRAEAQLGSSTQWATREFDLEFPGGPLESLIEQIHEQVPELNVIVEEEARNIEVQSLKFHNIVVASVLEAIEELLEPAIDVGPSNGPIEATPPVILIRVKRGQMRTAAFATKNISEDKNGDTLRELIEF
ncbi:MAG: hypothetical protein KDA66_09180, partial [Planctomycetaceae bacterium]|nr:hypothetical protein [Planctomycetaceae bacterium]